MIPGHVAWQGAVQGLGRHKNGKGQAGGGVSVGNHGVTHGHMVRQGLETVRAEIADGARRLRQELGVTPSVLAYPYGEYGLAIRDIAREQGLAGAFGQHSGTIGRTDDLFALPRYPMSENYGDGT